MCSTMDFTTLAPCSGFVCRFGPSCFRPGCTHAHGVAPPGMRPMDLEVSRARRWATFWTAELDHLLGQASRPGTPLGSAGSDAAVGLSDAGLADPEPHVNGMTTETDFSYQPFCDSADAADAADAAQTSEGQAAQHQWAGQAGLGEENNVLEVGAICEASQAQAAHLDPEASRGGVSEVISDLIALSLEGVRAALEGGRRQAALPRADRAVPGPCPDDHRAPDAALHCADCAVPGLCPDDRQAPDAAPQALPVGPRAAGDRIANPQHERRVPGPEAAFPRADRAVPGLCPDDRRVPDAAPLAPPVGPRAAGGRIAYPQHERRVPGLEAAFPGVDRAAPGPRPDDRQVAPPPRADRTVPGVKEFPEEHVEDYNGRLVHFEPRLDQTVEAWSEDWSEWGWNDSD